MRRKDESALDCRIRAAVQTDDIIKEWARNVGRKVQTDARCNGPQIQEAISVPGQILTLGQSSKI
eukprot:6230184-Pyramimonas_sp.AAC.1